MQCEIKQIRDRLADVNVVSFSGGKDSSVVLPAAAW